MGLMSHRENSSSGWGVGVVVPAQAKCWRYSFLLSHNPPPTMPFSASTSSVFMSLSIIFLCASPKRRNISVAGSWTHSQTCSECSSVKNKACFMRALSVREKNAHRENFYFILGINKKKNWLQYSVPIKVDAVSHMMNTCAFHLMCDTCPKYLITRENVWLLLKSRL